MEAVRASGVVKRFEQTLAVDGIDLEVWPGEVRGLLGPNGAGKTTLLRMLFGLIGPDAGSIELFGQPLRPPDSIPLQGVAGFVEDPKFYPYLSARTNLELLAELDGGATALPIDELLERVDLPRVGKDRCLALVVASWAVSVLPMLAFTSLAVLFSVASRNGIVGVLGPALVALVTQLLGLIGKGVWVHMLLVGSAFDGWHGLFTTEPFFGPLVVSSLVSLVWIAACLGISWAILRRRDFSGTPVTHKLGWVVPVRVVGIVIAVIALLAVASNGGPVGVTKARMEAAIAPEFNHITLLQQHLFGRQVPAGAQLDVRPNCNQHGERSRGPGRLGLHAGRVHPQAGQGPVPADRRVLRPQRPGQRLLQGTVAARVRGPADDPRLPRPRRRQPAVRGLRLL